MSDVKNSGFWCFKCSKGGTWVPQGDSVKVFRCGGCGDRFPCQHECGHVDCLEIRGKVAPDGSGILRPLDELQAMIEEAKGASHGENSDGT